MMHPGVEAARRVGRRQQRSQARHHGLLELAALRRSPRGIAAAMSRA
jgi:hypothetical protein